MNKETDLQTVDIYPYISILIKNSHTKLENEILEILLEDQKNNHKKKIKEFDDLSEYFAKKHEESFKKVSEQVTDQASEIYKKTHYHIIKAIADRLESEAYKVKDDSLKHENIMKCANIVRNDFLNK